MWTKENTPGRIRAILIAIDRKQVELAIIMSVSPVTVTRWVKGRSVPDPRSREKLEAIEFKYVNQGGMS
ncbi:MAG: helix-turn-helix domain-containing protein [Anaerolineales bacterium]